MRSRFASAVGIIAVANLALLVVFYDAYDWRELRTLAPVFLMMLLPLVNYRRVRVGLPVVLLAVFLPAIFFTGRVIVPQRRAVAAKYRDTPGMVQAFREIGSRIDKERMTTVLASRDLYKVRDIPLLALPVSNDGGFPIRYTFNIRKYEYDLRIQDPEFIDYVLATDSGPDGEEGLRLEPLDW
jgi:hypothetical protein